MQEEQQPDSPRLVFHVTTRIADVHTLPLITDDAECYNDLWTFPFGDILDSKEEENTRPSADVPHSPKKKNRLPLGDILPFTKKNSKSFRCKFCLKLDIHRDYVNTDGVRKHVRKYHSQHAFATRGHPDLYCIPTDF